MMGGKQRSPVIRVGFQVPTWLNRRERNSSGESKEQKQRPKKTQGTTFSFLCETLRSEKAESIFNRQRDIDHKAREA